MVFYLLGFDRSAVFSTSPVAGDSSRASSTSMDPQPNKSKPTHAWCCTATLESSATKKPVIKEVSGDAKKPFLSHQGKSYDITASPDWMEWIEVTEDRSNDEGGAGAYDTLRCDLIVKEPKGEEHQPRHTIWGEEYHMQRLVNSFLSLLIETRDNDLPENVLQVAKEDSHALLQALIQEAQCSHFLKDNNLVAPGEKEDEDYTWIQLIKLSLLWSLPKPNTEKGQSSSIVVRGHACSSAKPIPVFRSVQPIVVTLAALGHKQQNPRPLAEDAQIDYSLPTRFQNPQSKVALWCKQRKKMDNPETYKPQGVSEVLMLRPTTASTIQQDGRHANGDTPFSSLEVLEGLSSNAFVIYRDGTVRTAEEGVLFGYVRHLVLESAEKCGLKVDTTQPICLQDAMEGKWAEVFITSSSRLIWPVSRILLPASEADACPEDQDACKIDGFAEFWKDPMLTVPGAPLSTPRWQELLEEILHSAGYKR